MITLVVFWINAAYKLDSELIYIGTAMLDLFIIDGIVRVLTC